MVICNAHGVKVIWLFHGQCDSVESEEQVEIEEACGDGGREGQRLIGDAPDNGQSGDEHVGRV